MVNYHGKTSPPLSVVLPDDCTCWEIIFLRKRFSTWDVATLAICDAGILHTGGHIGPPPHIQSMSKRLSKKVSERGGGA